MLPHTKELLVQGAREQSGEGRQHQGGPGSAGPAPKAVAHHQPHPPTPQPPCTSVSFLTKVNPAILFPEKSLLVLVARAKKKKKKRLKLHCVSFPNLNSLLRGIKNKNYKCATRPEGLGLFKKSWEGLYCFFSSKTALTGHTRPR